MFMRNLYLLKQSPEGDENGGSTSRWQDSLPEELKTAADLQGFDSVEKLAANFVERGRFLDGSIRIPAPDASDEDKLAFQNRLMEKVPSLMPTPDFSDPNSVKDIVTRMGMPKDPKGYKNPEGVEVPDDEVFRKMAHDLNLTQSQYQGFIAGIAKQYGEQTAVAQQSQESNLMALKREWGLDFNDRNSRVSALLEIMDAPQGLKDSFKSKTMDVPTIKWLHEVASAMGSEGREIAQPTGSGNFTPVEATARIQEIMGNKEHAYWNPSNPLYENAKQEVLKLTAAQMGERR